MILLHKKGSNMNQKRIKPEYQSCPELRKSKHETFCCTVINHSKKYYHTKGGIF